jgi:PIN domain nuclease of toxin-antitoxin system
MIYALDTNTISYYLRDEGRVNEHFQREIKENDNIYAISYFCAYEIQRWLNYKPTRITRLYATQFDILFQNVCELADMPAPIWGKAVDIHIALQSKGKLIGGVAK